MCLPAAVWFWWGNCCELVARRWNNGYSRRTCWVFVTRRDYDTKMLNNSRVKRGCQFLFFSWRLFPACGKSHARGIISFFNNSPHATSFSLAYKTRSLSNPVSCVQNWTAKKKRTQRRPLPQIIHGGNCSFALFRVSFGTSTFFLVAKSTYHIQGCNEVTKLLSKICIFPPII